MKIVWTIAGSDSGGGAGIQADLHTFQDFQIHGCSAITAFTAQNTQGVLSIQAASAMNLSDQLSALKSDLTPASIKLGMLYDPELIQVVAEALSELSVPVVADPVLVSTSGAALFSSDFVDAYRTNIIPLCTLLTPNVFEAQALTGIDIKTYEDMKRAGEALLSMGARAVLLKGGDFADQNLASDFYLDSSHSCWINHYRIQTNHTHGTGCTLSASIAANLANNWSLIDSIIIAKAYVHAGLSRGTRFGIAHLGTAHLKNHFPWITDHPSDLAPPSKVLKQPIGRYPIVDNLDDLKMLCTKGIGMIQLRIKDPKDNFETICHEAAETCKKNGVIFIVNDYQIDELGLHRGQEDIVEGKPQNTILGISSHNLYELARAYAYHPSYLAMGPIFETQSKHLEYPPIGLDKLKFIASICPLPLVAIGGIPYAQIPEILALGCSGVAFIHSAKDLKQDGRFDRHFSLPDFDHHSQENLAQAKIVCVGIGGLAAGFLPYLAAAGIGEIRLIDHDTISYSNLQRQVLYKESEIGQLKVTAAKRFLNELNPLVQITAQAQKLNLDNAIELLSGYDLIIDGTDNFDAHYLINDVARYLKTDLISASVFQDKGQMFYFSPDSACYRCVFPEAPPAHERPSCNIAGVLGTTPGIMGVMQAQLAIDLLGNSTQKQSFCRTVNMKTWLVKNLQLSLASDCPCCHTALSIESIRSLNMTQEIKQLSVENLKAMFDAELEVHLLDVREDDERAEFSLGGDHIPIQELPERINELNDKLEYIVYCARGGRSSMACQFLASQGFKVVNLAGGAKGYQEKFDAAP